MDKRGIYNVCEKIHISSKLTQYLRNILKTRFLMRNCLKYAQKCQNGIFRKRVGQPRYPIQLCGSPLDIMYTMEIWEIP